LDNDIYDTEYCKEVTFNYNGMMSKTAVQKDRFPSQFEGCNVVWGGGLEPPKPKLSYVPVTDTSEHIRLLPFSFSVFHFLVFGSMQ